MQPSNLSHPSMAAVPPAAAADTAVLRLLGVGAAPCTELAAALARQPLLRSLRPARATWLHTCFDSPAHALAARGITLCVQDPLDGRAPGPSQLQLVWETAGTGLLWRRLRIWPWPLQAVRGAEPYAALPVWQTLLAEGLQPAELEPLCSIGLRRWHWRLPASGGLQIWLDDGLACSGGVHQAFVELSLLAPTLAAREHALQLLDELAREAALLLADRPAALRALDRAAGRAPAAIAPWRSELPLPQAAQAVLGSAWLQLHAHLALLPGSDDPQAVHQARVAWRRWRSLWRVLRRELPPPPGEVASALATLRDALAVLGPLRDLDVARLETLPQWARRQRLDDARLAGALHRLCLLLADEARRQRQRLPRTLLRPEVTAALWTLGGWIERLGQPGSPAAAADRDGVAALRRRLRRLHRRMRQTWAAGQSDPNQLHAARILVKRLRYAVEALAPLLPARKRQAWAEQARTLQNRLGAQRDLLRAAELAAAHGAPAELVAALQASAAPSRP